MSNLLICYFIIGISLFPLVKRFNFLSLADDVVFLALFVVLTLFSNKRLSSINYLLLAPLAITLILLSISSFSSFENLSFQYILWDFLYPFFFVVVGYFSFTYLDDIYNFLLRFSNVFFFFLAIPTVLGFFVPSLRFFNVATSIDGSSLRIGSFFENPNTYAYFLVIFTVVFLTHLLKCEKSAALLSCFKFLSSLLLVFFTTSRSAFLTLSISFFFIANMNWNTLLNLRNKLSIKLVLPSLIFLFSSLIFALSTGIFHVQRLFSLLLFNDLARFSLFSSFLDIYKSFTIRAQLLGAGPSHFYRVQDFVFDNYYLKLLLEVGVVGLSAYLIFLLYLFVDCFRVSRRCKFPYSSASFLFRYIFPSVLLLVFFSGFTSQILDVYPINYFISILAGLYLRARRA